MDAEAALAGRVAFVTGAARGIGRAIAIGLAEAGADVIVADLRLEPFRGEKYFRLRERWSGDDEADSTADVISRLGRRAAQVTVDVADPVAVQTAVDAGTAALGPIDILVNNAGIVNNIATIAAMSPESWDHELRVNLSGAFHCVRAVVPGMAERGFGRVINLSSVAARVPTLGQPAYSASKAGLLAFTRSVAQEFGRQGVTCNAVLPGLIATPLVMSMPEKLREEIARQCPVGRVGRPEEIAALVAFLASPAAGFITASEIPCDGGFTGAPLFGLGG